MTKFTYVYILQSERDLSTFYVGMTDDLAARLKKHNEGAVPHTSKLRPWGYKNGGGISGAGASIGV